MSPLWTRVLSMLFDIYSVSDLWLAMRMEEDDFLEQYGFPRPDKQGDEVIVYCQAGVRSEVAARFLRDDCGYERVLNYRGSAHEWFGEHQGAGTLPE
mgnify:CR=1 FL=1